MATGRIETGLIQIPDCSRGLSDWYPTRLADDQLAEAVNVEFWNAAVCGRRPGVTGKFNVAGAATLAPNGMTVHTPTVNRSEDELIIASSTGVTTRFTAAYTAIAMPKVPDDGFQFMLGVDWASLHAKLFIAAKSNVARLHVWDGTNVRRAGLAPQTQPPGVVDNCATGGTMSGTRTYRTRVVVRVGSVVVRRSEPSPQTVFTPAGTCSAVRIFPGAYPGEGETHWEV
ncbi:MAG TPA: hypothetical protein VFZ53_07615, partial [Polyangiaceae bacterium]